MFDELRAEMQSTEETHTVDSVESAPTPDVTASPEPPTPDASDVQDATPPPSDTGVAASDVKPKGPIPFDRHEAILENARKKAAEEATKQYEWVQKYGDAQSIQNRLAVTEWAERDPVGFLRTYAANQGIDPRSLFQQTAPQPPAAPELPDADILLENGQTAFSAESVKRLIELREQSLLQRVDQELAPIKQERAITQLQQQSVERARQQIDAAQRWAGFAEHKSEIGAFLRANPTASLHDAYIAVVPAKLAEQAQKASTEAYQKALTDLQTKAGAASGLTPRTSGAAPANDYSKMSMAEALRVAMAEG